MCQRGIEREKGEADVGRLCKAQSYEGTDRSVHCTHTWVCVAAAKTHSLTPPFPLQNEKEAFFSHNAGNASKHQLEQYTHAHTYIVMAVPFAACLRSLSFSHYSLYCSDISVQSM